MLGESRRAAWVVVFIAIGCASARTQTVAPPPRRPVSAPAPTPTRLDVHDWRVLERESGQVNYYTVIDDPALPFIRAQYRPPYATAVLGYELDDATRQRARRVQWKWRAVTLPAGGDECEPGKGDSAAVVYVTWKRGLRYYTLKYVWSAVGKPGAVCDTKRNPFVAQDTVILRSGAAGGSWKSEDVDLQAEFRQHFADGDTNAEVPGFLGVGIMTDGDQTESPSAADYADFVIVTAP